MQYESHKHTTSNSDMNASPTSARQPTGLICENLRFPREVAIRSRNPRFGWIVSHARNNAYQIGARIIVSNSYERILKKIGDMWDTGDPDLHRNWNTDDRSTNIEYRGKALEPDTEYWWRVKVWCDVNDSSPWSEPQAFRTGVFADGHTTACYRLRTVGQDPEGLIQRDDDVLFADFGKAGFGTVELDLTTDAEESVEVRIGEVLREAYEIEPAPGGSRRYSVHNIITTPGTRTYRVEIPADERNTGPAAIRMPIDMHEVTPFRYCEIVGTPGSVRNIRRLMTHYPFDDTASEFTSSNSVLNDVWDMCKYTMKVTTFCGLYVDGDRERIPYEADAYINQLGHYCTDREYSIARATHEYLLGHPTWPTEWAMHSVMMAWEDYLYTGDERSLACYYDDLCAKTLIDLADPDGLISSSSEMKTSGLIHRLHMDHETYPFDRALDDLIDWPPVERDGYELTSVNTVVNAFHYRAAILMSRIASALGKTDDARRFDKAARRTCAGINERLFDLSEGRYVDGEGSSHASLHANIFPLALGVVPPDRFASVVDFIKTRGMACSVYASQYLLDSLYNAGAADYALSLLTSTSERSWAHMIYDVGSTIALEAWDNRFKPNQDWNHAWGAVPANIIPRRLCGVQPVAPGFRELEIRPQPGDLAYAHVVVPTVRGPITVSFEQGRDSRFHLEVHIPGNTTATVLLPRGPRSDTGVAVDGKRIYAACVANSLMIPGVGSGTHSFEV